MWGVYSFLMNFLTQFWAFGKSYFKSAEGTLGAGASRGGARKRAVVASGVLTRQKGLQSNSGPMCAFVFVCWHCGEAMQTGHHIIKLQCSVVNSAGPL